MEALIKRAFLALGAGIPAPEVQERFQETGISAEDAYLAVKAAEILVRDESEIAWQKAERRNRRRTAPEIPALKK
jgi:hypothetical protein